MDKNNTLVLIDGSSLAFRSFFALFTTGLRTKEGVPTWAILGFFNSLFELIEKYNPQMLAVAFDLAEPTFRHIEFEDYKAHRAEMPDDLAIQWPLIKDGVIKLGLPVYELAGYEADDVIGTVAREAERRGFDVLILTGDQDAFQLIDGEEQKIKVLMPGKGGLQQYGRQEVYGKLGVWPEQIIDYKGLCGDSSDNIPGIRGVGPKTAQQLLADYHDMDGIYKSIDQIKQKALHSKLVEGESIARQSKALATIKLDVPIDFDFDHCQLTLPNSEELAAYFLGLEFKTLTNRLPKVLSNFSISLPDLNMPNVANSLSQKDNVQQGSASTLIDAPLLVTKPVPSEHKLLSKESRIINSELELENLVSILSKQKNISIYINASPWIPLSATAKTHGEPRIFGYAFAWQNQIAYVPIRQMVLALGGQPGLDRLLVHSKLAEVFLNADIEKNTYNVKQVLNLLNMENLNLVNVVQDVMLASYICSSDEKHGLHDQARRLLDHGTERVQQKSAKKNSKVVNAADDIGESAENALEDVSIIDNLAQYYNEHLSEDSKYLLNQMELPLAVVLAKIEQCGVALDLPYLETLSRELAIELVRLEKLIFDFAGHSFNINSTQQLQKVLFEELGLKTKNKTKTGFSTDAAVLESLRNEHEIIGCLLDYRQLNKLKTTYVDALPKMVCDIDKRIHGEFNQVVTTTGRLSSSNPNLQNIPIRSDLGRSIRGAFVPGEKNWVLMSVDYSQIELRFLAHMSDDPRLIDAFNKDQDVHARTAGEIFDVPIEQVTSEMRRVGKTLNFALIYQQGAFSTARDLGVSVKEASAFIDKYFSRYANVKVFMEQIINNARKDGYVETLWKRKRYFKFLNDRNEALKRADERAACNAPLQGSAADLMKLAMIRLDSELLKRNLKAKLIMQVHDELVLEVPETEVEQVKELVVTVMLMDQPLKVPLKVDVGIANNWMNVKY